MSCYKSGTCSTSISNVRLRLKQEGERGVKETAESQTKAKGGQRNKKEALQKKERRKEREGEKIRVGPSSLVRSLPLAPSGAARRRAAEEEEDEGPPSPSSPSSLTRRRREVGEEDQPPWEQAEATARGDPAAGKEAAAAADAVMERERERKRKRRASKRKRDTYSRSVPSGSTRNERQRKKEGNDIFAYGKSGRADG